jgi:hypothetical protein
MKKQGTFLVNILIGLIVAILIGVVILIVIGKIPFTGLIDESTCKASVEARSTFNLGPFEPGKNIPLKCKTENICIVIGSDSCDEFKGGSAEKRTIDKKNAKEEIEDIFSEEIVKCHSMLGAGNLDFMPHSWGKENYCLICSRIAFGKNTKEQIGEIPYFDIYQHMQEKKTSDGRNYLDYVYPGMESGKSTDIFNLIKNTATGTENEEATSFEFKDWQFENWAVYPASEGGYAIMAQMAPLGTWQKWVGIGTVLFVGAVEVVSVLSIPVSGPIGLGIAAFGAKILAANAVIGSGLIFVYADPNGKYEYLPPTIFPFNTDVLDSFKCSSFETAI